jgi:hypothetical protein
MKNPIILFSAILVLASCKKDIDACRHYSEIPVPSVDPSGINAPELHDTLNKYAQLKLERVSNDVFGWTATCGVYYNGLINFSGKYTLSKVSTTGTLHAGDTSLLRLPVNLSTEPVIDFNKAIETAKQRINLDHTCIRYKLGIFSLPYHAKKSYYLVWRIEGKDGHPFAYVDANQNYVLYAPNYPWRTLD